MEVSEDLINKIGADLRNAGYDVCSDNELVERGKQFRYEPVNIAAKDPEYNCVRVIGRVVPGPEKWFVGVYGQQNFVTMTKVAEFILSHYAKHVCIEEYFADSLHLKR